MSVSDSIQELVNRVILVFSENEALSMSGLPGFIFIGASLYELIKAILDYDSVGFSRTVQRLFKSMVFLLMIAMFYNSPRVFTNLLPIQTESRTKDVILDSYNNIRTFASKFQMMLRKHAGIDDKEGKTLASTLMARSTAIHICDVSKNGDEAKKICFNEKRELSSEALRKELDELYACPSGISVDFLCPITTFFRKNFTMASFLWALSWIAEGSRLIFSVLIAFYYTMSAILAYLAIKIVLPAIVYQNNRAEIKSALKQYFSIALVPAVIGLISYATNSVLTLMADIALSESPSMASVIASTILVGILCIIMIIAEGLISLKANQMANNLMNFKLDTIINLADTAKDAVLVAGSIITGFGVGVGAIASVMEAQRAMKNDATDEVKKRMGNPFSSGSGTGRTGSSNDTKQNFASSSHFSGPTPSYGGEQDVRATFRSTPEPMFDPREDFEDSAGEFGSKSSSSASRSSLSEEVSSSSKASGTQEKANNASGDGKSSRASGQSSSRNESSQSFKSRASNPTSMNIDEDLSDVKPVTPGRGKKITKLGVDAIKLTSNLAGGLLRLSVADDRVFGDMKNYMSNKLSEADKKSKNMRDSAVKRAYLDKELHVDVNDENFSSSLSEIQEGIHTEEDKLKSMEAELDNVEKEIENDLANEELLSKREDLKAQIDAQKVKYAKLQEQYQEKKSDLIRRSDTLDLTKDFDEDGLSDATNLYNLLAEPYRINDPELEAQLKDPFSHGLRKLSEMKIIQEATLMKIGSRVNEELVKYGTVSNKTRQLIEENKVVLGYKNVKDLQSKINKTIFTKKNKN